MDNYSIIDVNNVGMVNGTLSASSSTVATNTTALTNTGVTIGSTIYGNTFTNTIIGDKITLGTSLYASETKIEPASVRLQTTNSGVTSTISNSFAQSPYVTLTATSTNDPPDFPAQNCSLSTAGLVANNSFGWNLDVPILKTNGNLSTVGQVITANATGRPIWQSLPTPYISSSGVATGGITSLPSINAVGALSVGSNVSTTGVSIGNGTNNIDLTGIIRVGGTPNAGSNGQVLTSSGGSAVPTWQTLPASATPYISATGVASGGITSLPSINASGSMTIGGDVATTGLTIGSGNYTTAIGGNLGFGGNSVSGLNRVDGNTAVLAVGTQTTSNGVTIGRATQTTSLLGTVTAPTPTVADNTTNVATTAFTTTALANLLTTANTFSAIQNFTANSTALTQTSTDSSTRLATTAFVKSYIPSLNSVMTSGGANTVTTPKTLRINSANANNYATFNQAGLQIYDTIAGGSNLVCDLVADGFNLRSISQNYYANYRGEGFTTTAVSPNASSPTISVNNTGFRITAGTGGTNTAYNLGSLTDTTSFFNFAVNRLGLNSIFPTSNNSVLTANSTGAPFWGTPLFTGGFSTFTNSNTNSKYYSKSVAESVTLRATVAGTASTGTVTFSNAFSVAPTVVVSLNVIAGSQASTITTNTISGTGFQYTITGVVTSYSVNYIAIGDALATP